MKKFLEAVKSNQSMQLELAAAIAGVAEKHGYKTTLSFNKDYETSPPSADCACVALSIIGSTL